MDKHTHHIINRAIKWPSCIKHIVPLMHFAAICMLQLFAHMCICTYYLEVATVFDDSAEVCNACRVILAPSQCGVPTHSSLVPPSQCLSRPKYIRWASVSVVSTTILQKAYLHMPGNCIGFQTTTEQMTYLFSQ